MRQHREGRRGSDPQAIGADGGQPTGDESDGTHHKRRSDAVGGTAVWKREQEIDIGQRGEDSAAGDEPPPALPEDGVSHRDPAKCVPYR